MFTLSLLEARLRVLKVGSEISGGLVLFTLMELNADSSIPAAHLRPKHRERLPFLHSLGKDDFVI